MKIYDTSYGPDTFGRIRMGFIQQMFLSYHGFSKPQPGDELRISCTVKGVTRDVLSVSIVSAVDSYDEPDTVLIRVEVGRAASVNVSPNGVNVEHDFYTVPEGVSLH